MKEEIIVKLEQVLNEWARLLKILEKENKINAVVYESMNVKDILAHLKAWQEISILRLTAAKENIPLVFPEWAGDDPDNEGKTDEINRRIYELYQSKNWSTVCAEWKDGFTRFITLARGFSKKELEDKSTYSWLKGYSLEDVLKGSLEHHKEHLQILNKWHKHEY